MGTGLFSAHSLCKTRNKRAGALLFLAAGFRQTPQGREKPSGIINVPKGEGKIAAPPFASIYIRTKADKRSFYTANQRKNFLANVIQLVVFGIGIGLVSTRDETNSPIFERRVFVQILGKSPRKIATNGESHVFNFGCHCTFLQISLKFFEKSEKLALRFLERQQRLYSKIIAYSSKKVNYLHNTIKNTLTNFKSIYIINFELIFATISIKYNNESRV